MTYEKILKIAFSKLKNNKYIINPHLDADLLLVKVTKQSREYILSHKEQKINLIQQIKFRYLIHERFKNHPLAYLLKEKYFYGYKFKVNKNVLIPRWESEAIVDEIINIIKNNPLEKYSIFDIGTGSGCIIISVAKELEKKFPKVNIDKLKAIDISSQALKIAKQNYILNKINKKIEFLKSDLLKSIINNTRTSNTNLIISANLPYLKKEQLKHPTIKYEPNLALYGGLKGLDYYQQLLLEIKIIRNNFKQITLIMEIDPQQKNDINKLILSIYPNIQIITKKDLKGLSRLILINLN